MIPRAAAVSLLLSLALVPIAGASEPPVPALPGGCAQTGVDDRCERWSTIFDGAPAAEQSSEAGNHVALSPDGRTAFAAVSNRVGGQYGQTHWVVLASDAADGSQRWAARLDWPGNDAFPWQVAVSPDGRTVYATGLARIAALHSTALTIAYDAATGSELWRQFYDGPGETDVGYRLLLSPDGKRVYTAGATDTLAGLEQDVDVSVGAFDAATGEPLWRRSFGGERAGGNDYVTAFGMQPNGRRLFVTGASDAYAREFDADIATVAIALDKKGRKPRLAWRDQWDTSGTGSPDAVADLAVDPTGRRVYVTGLSRSQDTGVNSQVATEALDAATGSRTWSRLEPGDTPGYSHGIAIGAAGGRVFVAAKKANDGQRFFDWETIAYAGPSGKRLWGTTLGTPEVDGEYPDDLVATDEGVWVTGKIFDGRTNPLGYNGDIQGLSDAVTAAYDPATGAQRWVARYNATGYDRDTGRALAYEDGRLVVLAELDYKGDFTGVAQGDPNGRENFTDLGILGYDG